MPYADPKERSEYNKQYRRKHKKELDIYAARYRKKHREEIVEYLREWKKDNPDYDREWQKNHRNNKRKNQRKYYESLPPEQYQGYSRKRRARTKKNHFTNKEWQTLKSIYNNKCLGCGKTEKQLLKLGRKLVPDHVVPLCKNGSDTIRNIQPLCHGIGGCNNFKRAQVIDYR